MPPPPSVVASLYRDIDTEIIVTDAASAETIKYAANGFLAMKISFVNAVAALCEAVGADVHHVIEGIGSDRRIGRAFLRPGPGWGGSCFPKDSRALVSIAEQHGYDFSMMRGVIAVNDEQRERMVRKIVAAAGRDVTATDDGAWPGVRIGVLGLTFKAGTDDLRESPSLSVIAELRELGAEYRPTTRRPCRRSTRVGATRSPASICVPTSTRRRREPTWSWCSPSGRSSPTSISSDWPA